MLKDALNRPIRVGDTILTGRYNSTILDYVTTVVKVTESRVYIKLDRKVRTHKYDKTTKQWNTKTTEITKPLARYSHQVIVVNAQLEANRNDFPENFV